MSELGILIKYKRDERDKFVLIKHTVVEERISMGGSFCTILELKNNEVLYNSYGFLSDYINKLNNVIYEYRFNYGYYFN